MDIQLPLVNLLPARPEIRGISSLLAQLAPGQRIDAVVEGHIADNDYLLRLSESGLQLRARTPLALEAGRTLTLQVVESGDTPRLKIVPPEAAAPESGETETIRQAVREYLPRRQPAGGLAAALGRLLQGAPEDGQAKLPEPLRTAAASLARALPQPSRLAEAGGLQRAVRDSGLFLEARLAAAAPAQVPELAAADVKGRLLVLVEALRKQLQETDDAGGGAAEEAAEPAEDYRPRPAGERTPARQPAAEAAPRPAASKPAADTADTVPELRLAAAPKAPPAEPVPPAETGGPRPELPSVPAPKGVQTVAALPQQGAPGSPEAFPEPAAEGRQPFGAGGPADAAQPAAPRAELRALLHQAEGVLAGIVMDQLASLPPGDGRQALWQLEIPYAFGGHGDALRLKVVREGKRDAPPLQCFWSVTLELHPPGLGTVNARVSLSGGTVDGYFWSDRPETAQTIQAHLDLLAARLQHSGLKVGRLDTLPEAPAGAENFGPRGGGPLVDERA